MVKCNFRVVGAVVFLASVLALGGANAFGASLNWDNGSGNWQWDEVSTNWSVGNPWTDGQQAIFNGTAIGPITVPNGVNVTASSLVFQADGYSFTGGSITLNSSVGINVTPNTANATIGSTLIATSGMTLAGGGMLTLNGAGNTISGGSININQASTLAVTGGNITVTDSSSFYMGTSGQATDTPTYTQSGGSFTFSNTASNVYLGNKANTGLTTFNLNGGSFTTTGTGILNIAAASNAVVNVSGGSLTVGGFTVGESSSPAVTGTMNISSGNFNFGAANFESTISANVAGSRGVMGISGGTVTMAGPGSLCVGGVNNKAAGAVNQSGGLFNITSPQYFFMPQNQGYGGYTLSGGTINVGNGNGLSMANNPGTFALFNQSGGVSSFTKPLYINANTGSPTGAAVVDVSGGSLTAANWLMRTGSGLGVLTVRGGGFVQQTSGQFYVTNGAAATGVLNVLTGGTLAAWQIAAPTGASTINFDGGTLVPFGSSTTFVTSGVTNAFVYPGGLNLNTKGNSVTIAPALAAPTGYGVGTSLSTISVASGGSGYVGAPVVMFAPPAGGGVPATGVATMSGTDGTGYVTGITITSPGSGYASGENVAVSFNGGSNASNAALTAATAFTVPANTLNTSGGLTVTGNGALTLSNPATYGGATVITAGTLTAGTANAVPAATSLTLGGAGGTSGYFNLGGYNQQVGGLAMAAGATAATISNNGTSDATLTFNGSGGASTFAGVIQSGTHKTGLTVSAGSLSLTNVNTYSGPTNVSAGLLALSNASANNIANSPAITVASGGTLDTTGLNSGAGGLTLTAAQTLSGGGAVNGPLTTVSGSTIVPGSTSTIGTLTTGNLNLASGSKLTFVLGTPGSGTPGTGSLISVNGSLTLPSSGLSLNVVDNADNGGLGSLGSGLYELFAYTGGVSGFSAANTFSTPSGLTYTFSNPPGQIDVAISGQVLTWSSQTGGSGANDSGWNNTSTNWATGSHNASSYSDGSVVKFSDSNGVTGSLITSSTVTINADVAPASVTFSNSSVNYTVNGTAGITGVTGITLNGTGLVSLQSANSFTGPVAINAGALDIASNGALGNSSSSASGVTVASGAALQIQGGITTAAVPLGLNGAGLAASPAGALNNTSDANTYTGAITLDSASTITASAGTLTLGGVIGANYPLTVNGPGAVTAANTLTAGGGLTIAASGTLTLSGAGSTISGGSINVNQASTLAVTGGDITVTDASSLYLGNSGLAGDTATYAQNGGSFTFSNTASNVYLGNKAGTGLTTFTVSGGSFATTSKGTLYVGQQSNAVVNINGGSLTVGSFQAGSTTVGAVGTINLSAGNFNVVNSGGASVLGANNSAGPGLCGIMNISGGTANFVNVALNIGGGNNNGAGAVNQSGGVFNVNPGTIYLFMPQNQGYGGYTLSTGTLNVSAGQFSIANVATTCGLFSQSGGAANLNTNVYLGQDASNGGTAVIDVSGGTLTHTAGQFMYTGNSNSNGTGIVTVRGSGYLQEQTGGFHLTSGATGATGIVNVLTGGTLEVNQITSSTSGTSTINFDGGTLRVYKNNAGVNFFSGLSNALLYPGGLNLDTNGKSVTIGQALTAPAGYGLGLSGSTISVPSGGTGYIAPPVVTFAAPAGGGVPATGVATLTNGTVTAITITSPGSGYASGEYPTVTFNNGDTTSGADTTAASAFAVAANTQNLSGGLTVFGGGTLTLTSAANAYGGPTTVAAGTLKAGISDALPTTSTLILGGAGTSGVFDLDGNSVQVGGLAMAAGAAGGTITNNGGGDATLTFSGGVTASTFAGVIQSGPAYWQTTALLVSAGSLTLSGPDNTYTGGTEVRDGALLDVASSGAIPYGSGLTVDAGGTVVIVASDGAAMARGGAFARPAGAAVAAVPEPGTLALLAVAALVAGLGVWRRRKAS